MTTGQPIVATTFASAYNYWLPCDDGYTVGLLTNGYFLHRGAGAAGDHPYAYLTVIAVLAPWLAPRPVHDGRQRYEIGRSTPQP